MPREKAGEFAPSVRGSLRVVRMASDYGCVGVVVDAKPDAVDFYGQYGFISVDVVEGQCDARPAPIPMFLATRAIREALGGEDT